MSKEKYAIIALPMISSGFGLPSFPLTQSKSGPDPNIMKRSTGRIQSKIKKFGYRPGPVQSESSPMLISAEDHRHQKYQIQDYQSKDRLPVCRIL